MLAVEDRGDRAHQPELLLQALERRGHRGRLRLRGQVAEDERLAARPAHLDLDAVHGRQRDAGDDLPDAGEQIVDAVRDEVAPVDGHERGLLAGLVVDELDLAVLPEDPQPDLVPVAPDLRRRRQRQVRERPLQLARQDLRDLLSLDVDLERVVHVLVGRAGEIVAAPRLDPPRRRLDDPDRPRLGVAPAVLEDLDLDGLARQPPVRENHLAFEESQPPARVDDLLDADQHGFLTRFRAPPIATGTNDTP